VIITVYVCVITPSGLLTRY